MNLKKRRMGKNMGDPERRITTRVKSYGHDFVDCLHKVWAKKGTASYKLVFVAPDGTRFVWVKVETDQKNKETVIMLAKEQEKKV